MKPGQTMGVGLGLLLAWSARSVAFQPDALIRNDGDTDYVGDQVYTTTGEEQTISQGVARQGTAVYQVKVQNDGAESDRFRVTGPAGGSGWTVKYYSSLRGGQDITDRVANGGWATGLLAPGASRKIRMEITRDAAHPDDLKKNVLVTVASVGDPARQDAVCAVAVPWPPILEFTSVPPYGSFDHLRGRVRYVNPDDHGVAVYIYVGGWWTKPTFADPVTPINPDGTWDCDVTTGGSDQNATKIAAFLIPAGYAPPLLDGDENFPKELYANAVDWTLTTRGVTTARAIAFSGYEWWVKSGYWGPGPNEFSDSEDNVWVDGEGRLHLRITKRDEKWYCAEVFSKQSFGHGTYTFHLASPVDDLDPRVVLGLFTWSDDGAYAHREIDFEFSRWGDPDDPHNAQYVVQPWDQPGHRYRFPWPAGIADSTHRFTWASEEVHFQSLDSSDPNTVLEEWTFTGDVPPPGDENVRLNLWLYEGVAPTDGQEWEVIISQFEFTPLAGVSDMMIRLPSDATDTGDDVYNLDGTDQTKARRVNQGVTSKYRLKVQNDGAVTDRFQIVGAAGGSGWGVRYQDEAGTDITAQVIDEGWTTAPLAPGASQEFSVTVKPDATIPRGVTKEIRVTATATGDPTRKDAVKAVTTMANRQPDLWIKHGGTWLGDDIYNDDGTDQTGQRTVDSGVTAVYTARLYNDGDETETLVIKGPAGAADWAVEYYQGSRNVTDQVASAAGWLRRLGPGAYGQFTIKVTPNSGGSAAGSYEALVRAEAKLDPNQRDTIKTITRVR